MSTTKNIKAITYKEFLKNISQRTGYVQTDVANIFDSMSDLLLEEFLKLEENEELKIKICGCIMVTGKYVPERVMPNNVVSSLPLKTPENIIIKAKFANRFKDKLKHEYRRLRGIE